MVLVDIKVGAVDDLTGKVWPGSKLPDSEKFADALFLAPGSVIHSSVPGGSHAPAMRRTVFLTALILASLAACVGSDDDPRPVSFTRLPSPYMANPLSARDPSALPGPDDRSTRTIVVTDPLSWQDWWYRNESIHSPQPRPAVDFNRQTVAGVSLGWRSNGCYNVFISTVEETGGELIVTYGEQVPSGSGGCTQAVVYPLILIAIDRSGKPVRFVDGGKR